MYLTPSVQAPSFGYGDELMAAGHAQTVYDRDPSMRVAICNLKGRPRWDPLWDGNPVIARPDAVFAGEPVHRIHNAIGCRPYIQYPFTHAIGWKFTAWRARDHRGRLYLDPRELDRGARTQERFGSFVVIEPSPIAASNPNKAWPADYFAQLVLLCPDVTFVQIAHPEARLLFHVVPVPVATFRDACGILQYAAAYVGPEGGLHHAAAALSVPAVVIFGGCCSVDTTGYPEHTNLADRGPETPCGRWRRCDHCARAMRAITPATVAESLRAQLRTEVPA